MKIWKYYTRWRNFSLGFQLLTRNRIQATSVTRGGRSPWPSAKGGNKGGSYIFAKSIFGKSQDSRGNWRKRSLLPICFIAPPKKNPLASIRGKLELVLKRSILQLQCLHYSNEIPFLLDDRWINLETVPEAKQESFVTIEPNGRLFEKVPWSTFVAEHIFSATNTDEQR